MTESELCYLPATQVLERFANRTLSPVEYLDALIARAEEVEPVVNAFTSTRFEEAREKARQAEAVYAGNGACIRPLEGLPVAIKDSFNIAGQAATYGSLMLKNNVGTSTHIAVQRLLDAGAIIHARTTTPELNCAPVTNSHLFGVTSTPWDDRYTSGGSSGGCGATLAAGTSPLALGSDSGGSIRIPAAACGVVGYKPPHGRNPDGRAHGYDIYAAIGPMSRTVDDAMLMQNVLCGPHPHDNASLRPKYELLKSDDGIAGLKLGWTMNMGFFEVDDHVRANTMKMLDTLSDLGAELVEIDFGWTAEADRASQNYLDYLFGSVIRRFVERAPDLATPWAKYCAELSERTGAADMVAAYEVQAAMARKVGTILDECHAIVGPTLNSHEIAADMQPDATVLINGMEVDRLAGWSQCHPYNMLGRCPVLAIPSGVGSNGLPTSIQIAAQSMEDERVFRVGEAIERVKPWLDCDKHRPQLSPNHPVGRF